MMKEVIRSRAARAARDRDGCLLSSEQFFPRILRQDSGAESARIIEEIRGRSLQDPSHAVETIEVARAAAQDCLDPCSPSFEQSLDRWRSESDDEKRVEPRKVMLSPDDMDRLRRLVNLVTMAVGEMNLWLAGAGHEAVEVRD